MLSFIKGHNRVEEVVVVFTKRFDGNVARAFGVLHYLNDVVKV